MGIQGAMSLLAEDPRRFGRPWKCNWGDDNKKDPPADPPASADGAAADSGDEKDDNEEVKKVNGIMQEEPFILLVDGMSLLYHVTVDQGVSIHVSPSDIKEEVYRFVSLLLEAIPPFSELRIFMDGLAPKTKLSTQVDRLRSQAIRGDALDQMLRNNNNEMAYAKAARNGKLLPLLAEWAMIEAIEDLLSLSEARIALNGKILALHRPSRGEAEAYIDFWIGKRVKPNTKVHILADDTDFLVYTNCLGFISFKSLEIHEDRGGAVRLSGFEYLRQKFLDAFLPTGAIANEDAMPVVAALAGCDYVLKPEAQRVLIQAESKIVKSDIAGLRQKARNNPTKAQRLTATLRFVAHFIEREPENWVDSLCKAAAVSPSKQKESNGIKSKGVNPNNDEKKEDMMDSEHDEAGVRVAAILKEAFLSVRKAYFRALTVPNNPSFEWQPSSVEIRRLLEYGIFYCRPIVESWEPGESTPSNPRKRYLEDQSSRSTVSPSPDADSPVDFCAAVVSPPFTRQIRSWIEQDSIWLMPHFRQSRLRLYCLLVQFAKTGGAYSFEGGQLRLSPMWTNENPKVTEYVRSNNNGGNRGNGESSLQMQERDMEILQYDFISTGWWDAGELLTGDDAVDSACLFCILGNIKQAKPALNSCLRGSGIVFLTTLFLPYNLALTIILLGTLPPGLEEVDMDFVEEASRIEMDRVLPFVSVACHHALLISNTIRSLYGAQSDEQKLSNLTSKVEGRATGFRVSDILRHDVFLWIWNAIRSGADLEELQSDDSDDTEEMKFALKYMDNAIERLSSHVPQTTEWVEKMKSWKSRAKVMWVIWWDVFNVALNSTDSNEMNEWDKYILLLSRS